MPQVANELLGVNFPALEKEGQKREMIVRLQGLKQNEHIVVWKIIEALAEALQKYRP